jgi:zeaxanthin glucosyltransferase
MSQRVIFLHYHGIGHINPCLSLGNILERNGWKVVLAGAEFFRQYVTSQGFFYYGLRSVPFGLGFEKWVNTIRKKKLIYLATLRDRITDQLYFDREKELVKMLDELHPDMILIDASQSTDFIVLYPHLLTRKIKVALLHAMLPTYVLPGRPPVNSYALPGDKINTLLAVITFRRKRFRRSLLQKMKYFFFDNQLIIKRRIKKNAIPARFLSYTPSLFDFNLRELPELIVSPREFDFPGFEAESYQHYLGFMTYKRQPDSGYDSFNVSWKKILKEKTAKDSKLVYCSFGTIESDLKDSIPLFLEKLIAVVRGLNHLLIISINNHDTFEKLEVKQTDFLYVFPSVPQIEVLRYTDLFVTHGGLSSIHESIDAEVPMLLYPVHSDYDPKGNAARVVFHGMGLRGDVRKDSTLQIKKKITELLSNISFRHNVSRLKRINAGYKSEIFLLLLERMRVL